MGYHWDIPLIPLWLKELKNRGVVERAVADRRARYQSARRSGGGQPQKCTHSLQRAEGGRHGICWTTWWMLGVLKDHTHTCTHTQVSKAATSDEE